jgi:hypothetical protein
MKALPSLPPRQAAWAALALLGVLALPVARQALEASMSAHMLLQYPLLALAGYWLAADLPPLWRARLQRCNAHGITGLLASAMMLAILMIPRVLDLALVDGRIALAKALALVFCGAALRLSWRPAGLMLQGFYLGNVLPMMAVVGKLYASSPVRVCNAYLLDDQARLGQLLIWLSAGVALAWGALVVRSLMQREAVFNQPESSVASAVTPESAAPESR